MLLQAAGVAGLGALVAAIPTLLVRQHVRALLYFDAEGERTKPPEELTHAERWKVLLQGACIPRPVNERTPEVFGLPFQVSHVDVPDGTRLEAWTIEGDGDDQVLLFHGYSEKKDQVLGAVPWFHERGFTVHLVDFRASGGSTGKRTTLGAEEALDVAATVRWARAAAPNGRLLVYGFSMGGAAILGALGHEELAVDGAIVDGVFDRLSTTLAHRFRTLGLPASPGRELLMLVGSLELGRNAWKVAPADDAASVQVPVLVLNGTRDARVQVEEAKAIAAALPDGELVLLDGGEHAPAFESVPSAWNRAMESFLDRVEISPS